jgi:hypothetical protein
LNFKIPASHRVTTLHLASFNSSLIFAISDHETIAWRSYIVPAVRDIP